MNWYKKDTRSNLLIAHHEGQGRASAQLLKNALSSPDFSIDLISTSRAVDFKPAYGQSIVCTDVESAVGFSHVKGNVCVFAQSPYEVIEGNSAPLTEKKQLYMALHNSLSKARRVIALSETCRREIQQFHSKHIYLSRLPSTQSDVIAALPLEGIAIIVNDVDLRMYGGMLDRLQQFDPVLYLNASGKRPTAADTMGMCLPAAGLVPVRPLVQIYLGADRSECSPLRIVDAAASGAVVVQVAIDGMNREDGRWMPTDCIGYFNLERQDGDPAELTAFIAHMLDNRMFFDSILAAQRRYLPNYQSNRNAFFELLTK